MWRTKQCVSGTGRNKNHQKEESDETEIEMTEMPNIPTNKMVEWDKKSLSSARISKKPERSGHNPMVTKVEEESNCEEEPRLPSVIEIPHPKLQLELM